MESPNNKLPGWILYWFYATAAICTWDASFIMCRPHSFEGGSLASIWYLYKYYVPIDRRYADLGDVYVFAQSLMNYAEVILNIVTIFMHFKNNRHTRMLAMVVTVMTFWKTVLYFLMFTDLCGGRDKIGATSLVQEIFLFVIPNGFWIVVPFLVIVKLWVLLMDPEETDIESYNSNNTRRSRPAARSKKDL